MAEKATILVPSPGWHGRARGWLAPAMPYVWLGYLLLYPVPWLYSPPSTWDMVGSAIGIGLFLWVYFRIQNATGRPLYLGIAAIVLIGFAVGPFGGIWTVLPIYAAAMAGQARPIGRAILILALIGLAIALYALILSLPWPWWAPAVFFGVMVGLGTAYQTELEAKNRELERSQAEVRAIAMQAERERIARDLHDLLGHTLTLVAVKADLAAKLVDRDPARAKAEMQEVNAAARGALADIRAAVQGMRGTTLAAELALARRSLAAADVAVAVTGPSMVLSPAVEEALAMVLREAVTNVVRHAGATRCTIAVLDGGDGWLDLAVADDGRGGPVVAGHGVAGNGVAGMRSRVAALGGSLTIGPNPEGQGLRLVARLPADAEGVAA